MIYHRSNVILFFYFFAHLPRLKPGYIVRVTRKVYAFSVFFIMVWYTVLWYGIHHYNDSIVKTRYITLLLCNFFFFKYKCVYAYVYMCACSIINIHLL